MIFTAVQQIANYTVLLKWDLPTPRESGTYTVVVQRSGSPEGEWENLTTLSSPTTAMTYTDASAEIKAADTVVYYRLWIKPPSFNVSSGMGTSFYSEVVSIDHLLDTTNKIEKQFQIFNDRYVELSESTLARFYRIQFKVFKLRKWGTVCTYCYDPVLKLSKLEDCPTCLGVRFVNGYWSPVSIYGKIEPIDNDNNITETDNADINTTQITISNKVTLCKGDLLIDQIHKRVFIVDKTTQAEVQTIQLYQQLACKEISPNSIKYRLAAQ